MDIKKTIWWFVTELEADSLTEGERQAYKAALDALEKQVPKKPTELVSKLLADSGWRWKCPACGCACGENKYHLEVTQDDEYCTQCGQRLLWE